MGARAQVKIEVKPEKYIYLYTHWGADDLEETVAKSLKKDWRWDDPEYLARIIFDEMIGENQRTETGFGIGVLEHGDIEKLITIKNSDSIEVSDPYEKKTLFKGNFEEFIKRYL